MWSLSWCRPYRLPSCLPRTCWGVARMVWHREFFLFSLGCLGGSEYTPKKPISGKVSFEVFQVLLVKVKWTPSPVTVRGQTIDLTPKSSTLHANISEHALFRTGAGLSSTCCLGFNQTLSQGYCPSSSYFPFLTSTYGFWVFPITICKSRYTYSQ